MGIPVAYLGQQCGTCGLPGAPVEIPVAYLGHQCGTCGLPGTPVGLPVAYLRRHQWEYLELRQRAYLGVGRHQREYLWPV